MNTDSRLAGKSRSRFVFSSACHLFHSTTKPKEYRKRRDAELAAPKLKKKEAERSSAGFITLCTFWHRGEVIPQHLVEKPKKNSLWGHYLSPLIVSILCTDTHQSPKVSLRVLCVCPSFTLWNSGHRRCCWGLARQLKIRSLFVELKNPFLWYLAQTGPV